MIIPDIILSTVLMVIDKIKEWLGLIPFDTQIVYIAFSVLIAMILLRRPISRPITSVIIAVLVFLILVGGGSL